MTLLLNLLRALWLRVARLADALAALAVLLGIALQSLRGPGSYKARLATALAQPAAQLRVFALLRALRPNLVLKRRLVLAYDNSGTAVVTRNADVREVLARDDDFEVVYAPRMAMITDGDNFYLGMQPGARYQQDVSHMRLAMRRDDVPGRVAPFVASRAQALVAASGGSLDVPQQLGLRVPAHLLGDYFGLCGPDEATLIDWTTVLFWYLFADLGAAPEITTRATAAAAGFRDYLDGAIAARKASGELRDDVLGRCLKLQGASAGMDDRAIRNNLVGLMIGAVPTTSKSATQALDQLLDRPEALAGAQAAARSDDDSLLARYVFEALRFNPGNPVIYRRAVRDAVVAASTLRARNIPKGTLVFAANMSAMFDRALLPAPREFRVDRPWDHYLLWGAGVHTCAGDAINRVMIPGLLKPLLARPGLRRAPGAAGRLDMGGTPFPVHLRVEFDA